MDDNTLARKSDKKIKAVKEVLSTRFEVKEMELLHYYIGVKIFQDQAKGFVWIGQPTYATTLLERFGMETAKSVTTPVICGSQLVKARDSDKHATKVLC